MTRFPGGIYFDNNASTTVAPECVDAMVACLRSGALNPSSKHTLGDQAKQLVIEARHEIALFLGAAPSEVAFTSSGTEANHWAIQGALSLQPDRRHVITSEVEHPATLMLLRHLETQGLRVTYLPVDGEGRLNLDALEDTLTPSTALVSLMWANNETGVIFPVGAAAALAHSRGVLFHTDAVQAAGKVPIDLRQIPVDLLSLSGHKLHAPPGIGALYMRKGLRLPPLFFGHQERGSRGGTENIPGIVALGAACSLLRAKSASGDGSLERLRDRLEDGILRHCPGARVNGGGAERVPNTCNVQFGGFDAEAILGRLDRLGFQASAGAACSSAGTKPSHVLTAMGLDAAAALASIRFSLGHYNSEQEVVALLRVLPDVLSDLAVCTA